MTEVTGRFTVLRWAAQCFCAFHSAACFGLAAGLALVLLPEQVGANKPVPVADRCALAIVLAADISASVNDHEFRLQMNGFASAIRHPDFANRLAGAGDGIAITLVLWSSTKQQFQVVDWTLVSDARAAHALASRIEHVARPRTLLGTGTAVGAAMLYSAKLLSDAPFKCWRRVIDVSGDGRSNVGPKPTIARDLIVAQGITINGLAIVSDEPDLNDYYRDHVIGGDGAFVIVAANHESFDVAIRNKLLREVLPRITQR